MNQEREKIIIGYNNTLRNPTLAVEYKNKLYVESFEKIFQKRRTPFLVDELKAFKNLKKTLLKMGLPFSKPIDLSLRTVGKRLSFSWRMNKYFKFILEGINFFQKKKSRYRVNPLVPSLEFYCWKAPLKSSSLSLFQIKHYLWGNFVENYHHKKTPLHLVKASNAVYTSTFKRCAVMILGGVGEEFSCTLYHFKKNTFTTLYKSRSNLGGLYAKITEICGFSSIHGEEWKVMSLSAYGKFNQGLYDFFKRRMVVKGLSMSLNFHSRDWKVLYDLLGEFRSPDDPDVMKSACLAYNFQEAFSEVVIDLANQLALRTGEVDLVYGGWCALNSVTNGRIVTHTAFENLHIPLAPGEDGNSLGLLLFQKFCVEKKNRSLSWPVFGSSPYLGSEVDKDDLELILTSWGGDFEKLEEDELIKKVAGFLVKGKIIGWFRGKAEFGSKALGNRSIFADPRDAGMRDKINELVKGREFFGPLSPSILHDFGHDYFENYQRTPYREKSLLFKENAKALVPAVVHKDGTGQLQSVHKELNPLFYRLIFEFYNLTKIPLIINTNFNRGEGPIVHSVSEALMTFQTTGLDLLVIGPYLLKK